MRYRRATHDSLRLPCGIRSAHVPGESPCRCKGDSLGDGRSVHTVHVLQQRREVCSPGTCDAPAIVAQLSAPRRAGYIVDDCPGQMAAIEASVQAPSRFRDEGCCFIGVWHGGVYAWRGSHLFAAMRPYRKRTAALRVRRAVSTRLGHSATPVTFAGFSCCAPGSSGASPLRTAIHSKICRHRSRCIALIAMQSTSICHMLKILLTQRPH